MKVWLSTIMSGKAIKRFPASVIWALLSTIFFILALYFIENSEIHYPIRLALSSYIGFLVSLAMVFCAERYQSIDKWITIGASVLGAAGTYLLLPTILEGQEPIHWRWPIWYFSSVLILHLFISVVPFLDAEEELFWSINRKWAYNFLVSALLSIIAYAGLCLVALSLDHLFGLPVDSKLYGYFFVGVFGIIHTLYFLGACPSIDAFEQGSTISKLESFLIRYIEIPILSIYYLILVAFGLKILMQQSLPKGWLGSLSLWMLILSGAVYVIHHFSIKKLDVKIFRKYISWHWTLSLAPIVLLAIAVGTRLGEYGITEQRYFVTIALIWLTGCAIYHLLSKSRNLKWIPLSLMVLLIIAILPQPMNVFRSTVSSQSSRLKNSLIEEGFLRDRSIVKSDSLQYFSNYELISFLDRRSDFQFVYDWINVPELEETVGADQTRNAISKEAFWLGQQLNASSEQYLATRYIALDSKMENIFSINNYNSAFQFSIFTNSSNNESVEIKSELDINIDAQTIIDEFVRNPEDGSGNLNFDQQMTRDSLIYNSVDPMNQYKILFKNIQLRREDDRWFIDHLEGLVLIR